MSMYESSKDSSPIIYESESSVPRIYEAVYTYEEPVTLVEPSDNEDHLRQRITSADYREIATDDDQRLVIEENSLGKRRLIETPPIYYPMSEASGHLVALKT